MPITTRNGTPTSAQTTTTTMTKQYQQLITRSVTPALSGTEAESSTVPCTPVAKLTTTSRRRVLTRASTMQPSSSPCRAILSTSVTGHSARRCTGTFRLIRYLRARFIKPLPRRTSMDRTHGSSDTTSRPEKGSLSISFQRKESGQITMYVSYTYRFPYDEKWLTFNLVIY